ncbi:MULTISPECIES: type II restriction endonuclease [unclassified Haloarcula]|uniref:type II restriction endonuclease n=1 Tax=unclassified Haloarcula TaxID=2624677 RepID=UPI001F3DD59D|nr:MULTISPECIES: type II restriction endonuclease [unclassified Haloarcula]
MEEFQSTVIPSAIPNEMFIDYERIEDKLDANRNRIRSVQSWSGLSRAEFETEITGTLMDTNETREWIDFLFELVGETGIRYSSAEGTWKFHSYKKDIDSGNRDAAAELAELLCDIDLQQIVDDTDRIESHYRGLLVGLEPNKRKNRQGTGFEALVEERLNTVVGELEDDGFDVSYKKEYVTAYKDDTGQEKKVDYALFEDGELRLTVEANAYKSRGSKPSEIRRSYNHVGGRMYNDGVAFTWVTDGQAWDGPLSNVLRQSYDDLTDIYNLHMMDDEWMDDVLRFFHTGEV